MHVANSITMTDVRLIADPELRFTPGGDAVGNIRIVDNKRKKNEQTGQWEDASATFLTCTGWRQMAERMVEDLKQGDLLNISGELVQRNYETKEGEKRTVYEIQLASVGKSLRWLDKEKPSRPSRASSFEEEPPF
jgi:single-strand DNA-binding protein